MKFEKTLFFLQILERKQISKERFKIQRNKNMNASLFSNHKRNDFIEERQLVEFGIIPLKNAPTT